MLIDSRAHTASLIAVFLSLGIGILIGSFMVGERITQGLLTERDKLVLRLEEEYRGLKEKSLSLHNDYLGLEQTLLLYERYAENTLPAVLSGRLAGRRVMLVNEATVTDYELLEKNLRLAGAELVFGEVNADGIISIVGMGSDHGQLDAVIVIVKDIRAKNIPTQIPQENGWLTIEALAPIPEQVELIMEIAGRGVN